MWYTDLQPALRSQSGRRLVERIGRVFGRGVWILAWGVPLVAIEAGLAGRFPRTHALIDDWANHAHYVLVFLYGYLIICDGKLAAGIGRSKWLALVLGVVCTIGVQAGWARGDDRDWVRGLARVTLWSGGEWCWLLALLGIGQAYLNRPSAWLGYAAKVAYPFYILHQTVIVILAYYVVKWDWSVAAKFWLISTATIVVTAALCEAARHWVVSRWTLGMGKG